MALFTRPQDVPPLLRHGVEGVTAEPNPPTTDDPRDLSDPPIRIDDSFGSGGSSKDRRRARRQSVQEAIMQLDRDAESDDSAASKTAVRPVTADDIRDNAILVRLLPHGYPVAE